MTDTATPRNEAAERLQRLVDEHPMYEGDLDAALDHARQQGREEAVREIRAVTRYDLDGYPGAEEFQPSPTGDYIMAEDLDAIASPSEEPTDDERREYNEWRAAGEIDHD